MKKVNDLLLQTYLVALPIILTALMGYIVWLLKKTEKGQGCKQQGNHAASACTAD